jgi:hypothetical protein
MTPDRDIEGVLAQCALVQYQSDAVVSRTILKAGGAASPPSRSMAGKS